MKRKLKVTFKFLHNVAFKYLETKNHTAENLKEFCEGEGLTVEETIYLVVCLCLWDFEQICDLVFHLVAILLVVIYWQTYCIP